MASIFKKIIRGRPYYYARVCKRVDGKPKIVSQTYLGRADKIIEKLRAAPVPAQPLEAVVREFGASTALLALARRLQLVEHIDRHVPKRGSGPSVGTYLLAAVLNRCLAPGSKASLARWFDSTALGRLLPLRSSQLTSQRFWDHMHRVPVSALPAIERDIVAAMTREFGLDLRQVLFDATNFFTYINSFNERSQLAQRGHSKEGRRSLRIIGVALLVTADCRLPLLHRTYPGNRPDAPLFQSLAADLARRYQRDRRRRRDGHLGLRQGQQLAREPGLGRARPLPLHRLAGADPAPGPAGRAGGPDALAGGRRAGWRARLPHRLRRCSASSARCW